VPLLVSTRNATDLLPHERIVTVDAGNQTVYDGMVDQLLVEKGPPVIDTSIPYFRKLKAIHDFIAPLKLLDPRAANFVPESCRSMHDIIRFVHEKGVQSMFGIGDRLGSRARGAVKLVSQLPLDVFLLDIGGGLLAGKTRGNNVTVEQIACEPLLALWKGLSHRGVRWEDRSHFDWKTFDEVVMAGGIARKDSADFASYAVIDKDYLNLNMRFGYHFAIIDTLCGEKKKENYCLLRFAGGGGDFSGRSLRIAFLDSVLGKIGFQVDYKGDLLDARIADIQAETLADLLDLIGKLLGATKLMDMALRGNEQVDRYVHDFFQGRYNFVGDDQSDRNLPARSHSFEGK
jgi:pyruvate,water dikinase